MDRLLTRIDQDELVDGVAREEGKLLPRLIARREDLDNERRCRLPDTAGASSVQATVGYAEVVFELAEGEFMHRWHKTSASRRAVEDDRELLGNVRMLPRWRRNQVPNSLPNLVESIESRPAPALQQLVEPDRGGFEDQRAHRDRIFPSASSIRSRRQADAILSRVLVGRGERASRHGQRSARRFSGRCTKLG
ncbi:MAG TPA: hypothetical protein VF526_18080, partial [Solirubrobacteraceae bacterium]